MATIQNKPCGTCERPTDSADAEHCNNCWEVERRLGEYLKSAKGRAYVLRETLKSRVDTGHFAYTEALLLDADAGSDGAAVKEAVRVLEATGLPAVFLRFNEITTKVYPEDNEDSVYDRHRRGYQRRHG